MTTVIKQIKRTKNEKIADKALELFIHRAVHRHYFTMEQAFSILGWEQCPELQHPAQSDLPLAKITKKG